MRTIQGKMFLAFSTTTDLVDRMEKNDLVVRIREEQDRRVVRIKLLEEGERIIEEVIKKRQDYLEAVLEDFSEEEVEQFSSLLEKMHINMK